MSEQQETTKSRLGHKRQRSEKREEEESSLPQSLNKEQEINILQVIQQNKDLISTILSPRAGSSYENNIEKMKLNDILQKINGIHLKIKQLLNLIPLADLNEMPEWRELEKYWKTD